MFPPRTRLRAAPVLCLILIVAGSLLAAGCAGVYGTNGTLLRAQGELAEVGRLEHCAD